MIQVEEQEAIRRAYFVEDKSIRAIAEELHHGRRVVRRAIESADPAEYKLKEPREAPVLGPYKGRIDELLVENRTLPRKQRYTAHRIFALIWADGYRGAESTVRGYVGQRRRELRKPQVYLPLIFDAGQDGQVDWFEAVVVLAGQRVTVHVLSIFARHGATRFSAGLVHSDESTMETRAENAVGKERVRDQAEGSIGTSSVRRRWPCERKLLPVMTRTVAR